MWHTLNCKVAAQQRGEVENGSLKGSGEMAQKRVGGNNLRRKLPLDLPTQNVHLSFQKAS